VVEPPNLNRPSREQVYRRRVVALIVLSLAVAGAVWAGWRALKEDSSTPPAPTTTVGPPEQIRITLPEGLTVNQMAAAADEASRRVTAAGYLRQARSQERPAGFGNPRSPEGFMFPDTYFVFESNPAAALVEKQLENFRTKWRKVDMSYAHSKNLTNYDVLIIASMIEKEVVVPRERRLVAAVIYNRLHEQMPLGIDATLRYGLDIPPTEAITKSQLASDSPYNTRKFRGLPPTPIANPGLASIQAAAHPPKVDYVYFVRKPDCRSHFFTASAQAFLDYTRKGLTSC
jgi:peptidoglycan lytic transglycosylase G